MVEEANRNEERKKISKCHLIRSNLFAIGGYPKKVIVFHCAEEAKARNGRPQNCKTIMWSMTLEEVNRALRVGG